MARVCTYLAICFLNASCSVGLVIQKRCVNGTTGCNLDPESPQCNAPDNVTTHIKLRGLSLLTRAAAFAVYGADLGTELELLVYDCKRSRRLEFLHIPKNAGTTIENVGFSSNVEWGRFKMTEGPTKMPDGNKCSTWHLPPAYLPSPNPYEDEDVDIFCVTRDPWDRMISEYLYRVNHPEWAAMAPHIKDGPVCTKDGFNSFVVGSVADVEAGKPFIMDCHLVPQWDYIKDSSGHEWCKHVLPIEGLTQAFNHIMSDYELPVRLAPHNKDNSASSVCPKIKEQAPSELYDEPAKAAVRRMWAVDFMHLGDSIDDPRVMLKIGNSTEQALGDGNRKIARQVATTRRFESDASTASHAPKPSLKTLAK